MTEPIIQPPPREQFPWRTLVVGLAILMLMAAAHYYREPIVERGQEVAKQIGFNPTPKSRVDERIEAVKQLVVEYRSIMTQLATATGQVRGDLLDRRTVIVGNIRKHLDLIPAERIPEEAQRFSLER